MSIPQHLPKLFKEYYKNYEYKDYGIGRYKLLLDYSKDIKEYKESTDFKDQSLSITHTRVFLSPYKANKLNFAFALGLDDYLEKENITELKIVIGGVYGEGEKQSKILATLASNDDRLVYEALEKSKEEKQITEIYFSYGDDEIRLNDTSKHYKDINLHITTQGYNEGEEVEVKIKTQDNSFTLKGKVNNNKVFIKNAFKDK
ncbi:hypothetical protein [Helicobacter sp. MIT 14-3879]|uniref:hypothetical protein n=1 Tax=Helicobacter sp. MIT 14-3879 TaxID=2040649 RepID=UPI000E1EE368|nr:hypothetical protein [Helicobacter sp. MIT 14-3879]RDU59294.1 hypothetical protein CQA44_11555 [Helicobacter sp. MIT 14-3879]